MIQEDKETSTVDEVILPPPRMEYRKDIGNIAKQASSLLLSQVARTPARRRPRRDGVEGRG